jgi:autotransporter-associated beta strand protein
MKSKASLRAFLLGSTLLAGQSAHAQATYTWANSNVTEATPDTSLNWFNATQGAWTGGTPVSNNTNTIQFFQDSGTDLTNTVPATQAAVIDNGGTAFELGTLTLSGKASATTGANMVMDISGDALNFSAATGTIKLDALNATPTITYKVNSAIELGTASSASALTLTGNGSSTFDIRGSISELQSGGGSLIKSGSSAVILSGFNTYTGNTYINSGTLVMASNLIETSPNIYLGDGAKLQIGRTPNGFNLTSGQTFTGTGTTGTMVNTFKNNALNLLMTDSNTISTSGSLFLPRLDVNGTGNQMTGGNIQAGGGNQNGGTGRGLVVGNQRSGTFTITGGTFTSVGGGTFPDVVGALRPGDGTFIINGGNYVNTFSAGTLSLGLNRLGAGMLTLTSGSATINTLLYNTDPVDTTTTGAGIVNLDGGTLTLSAITVTGGFTKEFNFNGGQFVAGTSFNPGSGLTLNVKDGGAKIDTNVFNVTISDDLLNSGSGGLTKSGTGKLVLGGNSTYTGATVISGGTLAVTGSLGATAVSVANAATLSGNGYIGGNVSIASGATHSLAVAATTGAQVTRAITGTLTLTSGNILNLTAAATPTAGVYVLATATTAITGTPTTINYNGITGTVSVDTAGSPKRLLLTVTAGTPYDTWANGSFAKAFTDKLPGSNPDGDGLTNLQEFAFGTDPTVSSGGSITWSGAAVTGHGTPVVIQESGIYYAVYGRRVDYATSGLTYIQQFSPRLSTWGNFATAPTVIATDGTIEAVKVPFPGLFDYGSGPEKATFFRMKVSQ